MILFYILSLFPLFFLLLFFLLVITSKGECYYCGSRLERVRRVNGKKWCGCDIWSRENDGRTTGKAIRREINKGQ